MMSLYGVALQFPFIGTKVVQALALKKYKSEQMQIMQFYLMTQLLEM